ncbi:hypothetical protein CPC16_006888 [Podila verticillata]|nr:hypothetical protein BGZ59_000808 [Podila verticillata]KAF9387731.1 hypothetical protein CPC16_006888 [Podila verticillata]KAI9237918.1 MAG: hypothetical protein BYD32DRAFT_436218 [Podila humilis]KFH67592.1 hypothetical protein MVEG_06324 [Podila verticillata NRRL 6337]
MQPAVFSSVRTNLANLPRSISPHIASPTSPSSIRSLSPSRNLRSRSSSPSPRRFASVLAYNAAPSPEGNGRSKRSQEAEQQHNHQDTSGSRDQSPGSDVVKNLEESWRRFELEANSQSSPTLGFSNSAFSTPHHSRPSSPLSRKPYRELIECNSFKSSKLNESTMAPKDKEGAKQVAPSATSRSKDGQDQVSISEKSTTAGKGTPEGGIHAVGAASGPSSAPQERLSTATGSAHSNRGYSSTFLASTEARHILNLPSLLGQDPSDISSILPLVATGPSSGGHHQPQPTMAQPTLHSQMLLNLDAKAEATAEAMTKRYEAKNLNMTETEAHRMVQVMAAEIVALHQERQQMQAKLEQARLEMLEAAQLLRMRAAESEMQDMSEEGRRRRVGEAESLSSGRQDEDEEEKQREAQRAMYAKDEWRGDHQD